MKRVNLPALFFAVFLAPILPLIGGCGATDKDSETISDPINTETEQNDATVGELPTSSETAAHKVTLIQLNDLHAALVPHAEQVRQAGSDKILIEQRGGIARIATKIKQIKATADHSILMNIGDTFHGGAEALFSNGNDIVKIINQLNVDVGVPGNWDFAYGPMVTNARFGNTNHEDVTRPNYPNLAANATYRVPENITAPIMQNMIKSMFSFEAGEQFLEPTSIIEKDGVKIGMIGLTSDIVEKMHTMMAFNIEFVEGKEAYITLLKTYSDQLKSEGAHLIVVMSELGIHKDWTLAKALEKDVVDVFFSAHTHEATFDPKVTSNQTIVVEAGNDTLLGEMVVSFNEQKQPINYDWTLHAITSDIEPDPTIQQAVTAIRAPYLVESPNLSIPSVSPSSGGTMMPEMFTQTLTKSLDKTLTNLSIPLSRRHALENEFNNVYTDLIRHHAETDVALSPGFRFDSAVIPHEHDHSGDETHYYWETENNVVLDGKVTVADAYRFFPAPYHVAKGNVTGARLKSIIEENLNAVFSPDTFEQAGGWVDGFSGLKMKLDLSQPQGNRIITISKEDGSAITDEEILTVVGCARPMDTEAETTLCSYDGFTQVQNLANPNDSEQSYAAADLFIDAMIDDWISTYQITTRTNITQENAVQFWPDIEFYQPLEGVATTEGAQ